MSIFDTIATLREAANYWKGRSRPEGDSDTGETAINRCYPEDWTIYVCSLDGAPLLEAIAERWPEDVRSVKHDPAHGTTVVLAGDKWSPHSGLKRKVEWTDERKAKAAARLAAAREANT